jgi:hypothetical protein
MIRKFILNSELRFEFMFIFKIWKMKFTFNFEQKKEMINQL